MLRSFLFLSLALCVACSMKLHIVYYVFLYPPRDFRWLVEAQMEHLCRTEILYNSTLHVAISTTGESSIDREAHYRLHNATALIEQLIYQCFKNRPEQPSFTIDVSIANSYEYPGISLIYDVSRKTIEAERNDTVVLYFHTKGMVFHPDEKRRIDEGLFSVVIEPWQSVLEYFRDDPGLNKAGYASSDHGSIWYNFFYVRASLAVLLVRPIMAPDDRYWYEHWLSRIEADPIQVYNNQNVTLRLDFMPSPDRPRVDTLSSCADGWSMCLPFYRRGLAIEPHLLDKCLTMTEESINDNFKTRTFAPNCLEVY